MSQTKSQATLGTLTYMAPDQIRSDPVDARADLWALGVILYEMLTGAPPFSGDNELSLLNAILHDEATRPSQANPNIPRALDRLIMALLQKDPAHRYDSADALLTDIDAVERGEALSHRIPVWAIATQRRSVRIAAIAVTLFLAFGATGMLTWRLAQSRRVSRTAPPVGTRTVAVLPFANVDRNSKDEYLASGFTDEIISRLSKVRALKIAGLSSVSALLGQGLSPQVVGDRLGATHGIDGSIRVIGDTMQAQVRLTRLSDTQIVWSQKFLAPLSSVLRLEEEIADSIIGHLQPTSARSLKLTRPPTNDLQAYTLYYRGRYAWEQRTPEKFEEALALYNGAVERDPEFALAYAVMAEAYVNMQNFGLMPAREALARADVASAKAIALDTALAEGYAARGQYLSALGSYSNAEAALKRAIAINPSAPWAHHYYALLLTMMGRFDEAKDQLRTTLAIDPLSVPGTSTLAILLAHEGRLGEARAQFRRALQLSPNFVVTLYYFAALEVAHANYDEARNLLERALSIAPNFSGVRGALAVTYRELGRGDEAQRLMAQERSNALDERSRTHYGLALALVGESDSAFAVLRTAQWDIPTLIDLRVDPLLNRFRADPRYAELLARFRLRR